MTNQTFIGGIALLLVGVLAGGFMVHSFSTNSVTTLQTAGASPSGTTFSTYKYYGITVNTSTAGAGATSTSITNTDSNDRYITGVAIGCSNVGSSRTAYTGTGLASWQIQIGTTSTANPVSFASIAPITTGFVLGTSTTILNVASSTLQLATSSLASLWNAGAPLTFWFNATNTAVCTVGVTTIGS